MLCVAGQALAHAVEPIDMSSSDGVNAPKARANEYDKASMTRQLLDDPEASELWASLHGTGKLAERKDTH